MLAMLVFTQSPSAMQLRGWSGIFLYLWSTLSNTWEHTYKWASKWAMRGMNGVGVWEWWLVERRREIKWTHTGGMKCREKLREVSASLILALSLAFSNRLETTPNVEVGNITCGVNFIRRSWELNVDKSDEKASGYFASPNLVLSLTGQRLRDSMEKGESQRQFSFRRRSGMRWWWNGVRLGWEEDERRKVMGSSENQTFVWLRGFSKLEENQSEITRRLWNTARKD